MPVSAENPEAVKVAALKEQLEEIGAGLAEVHKTASARIDLLKADHKAIRAAVNSAKRLKENDRLLNKQLQAVDVQLESDHRSAADALSALAEMNGLASKELASLHKLLGGEDLRPARRSR
jgi:hypothetical protein